MLNELLIAQRGAEKAGVTMQQRHPDIKDTRRMSTLHVGLSEDGLVAWARPVASEVKPWTLRDGQHNSFPFIQPKRPLLIVADDQRRKDALNRKNERRRSLLLELIKESELNPASLREAAAAGLRRRILQRRTELQSLEGSAGVVFLHTIDRFITGTASEEAADALLAALIKQCVTELRQSTSADWLEVSAALLIEGNGALWFDADPRGRTLLDPHVLASVSEALRANSGPGNGRCALTGKTTLLVESKFPQPNLPMLGQTYLFARNKDTPANDRYGRFSADTMLVGEATAIQLAAAAEALTSKDRLGQTWCTIPGESPKVSDLLVAFVDASADVSLPNTLADDEADDDFDDDDIREQAAIAKSIAAFQKRTERIVDSVKAAVDGDFRKTPARLAIFRKLDPANRKVIYAGLQTVGDFYLAATDWLAGELNVPSVALPIVAKGERKPRKVPPPHVAPLGLIAFCKQLFIRGGTERQEVTGLPASEALAFFFDCQHSPQQLRRAARILRLVLARRTTLLAQTAHAATRGFADLTKFDRREALRTITVLGVLLHKLGQREKCYMENPAFKLGQLLAAADTVHVGYCMDVRSGSLPPSLLGNQVFVMAQSAPAKALAALCRRWKPYAAWAKTSSRKSGQIQAALKGNNDQEKRRAWDIIHAWRIAPQMASLADELMPNLAGLVMNDQRRAELLLGYISGVPKALRKQAAETTDSNPTTSEEAV